MSVPAGKDGINLPFHRGERERSGKCWGWGGGKRLFGRQIYGVCSKKHVFPGAPPGLNPSVLHGHPLLASQDQQQPRPAAGILGTGGCPCSGHHLVVKPQRLRLQSLRECNLGTGSMCRVRWRPRQGSSDGEWAYLGLLSDPWSHTVKAVAANGDPLAKEGQQDGQNRTEGRQFHTH